MKAKTERRSRFKESQNQSARARVVAKCCGEVPDASIASCVHNSVSMSRASVRCFQWLLTSVAVESKFKEGINVCI